MGKTVLNILGGDNSKIKHVCIGAVDSNGLFLVATDSDSQIYYNFSDEADLIAIQHHKITELEDDVERLTNDLEAAEEDIEQTKKYFAKKREKLLKHSNKVAENAKQLKAHNEEIERLLISVVMQLPKTKRETALQKLNDYGIGA